MASNSPPQKRSLMITPMSTSYAAEDERPKPQSTLESTHALKPYTGKPIDLILDTIPRTMLADVPFSDSTG